MDSLSTIDYVKIFGVMCGFPLSLITLYCLLFLFLRNKFITRPSQVKIRKIIFIVLAPIGLLIYAPFVYGAYMGYSLSEMLTSSQLDLFAGSAAVTTLIVFVLWIQSMFIKSKAIAS